MAIRDDRTVEKLVELTVTVRGLAEASKATTELMGKMADKQEKNVITIAALDKRLAILEERSGGNWVAKMAILLSLASLGLMLWRTLNP